MGESNAEVSGSVPESGLNFDTDNVIGFFGDAR